jgi:prepilin-type N-terminal cleavage/methylation domain-containing protein/prepilin-type processing-associated H-X9-DG protein
MARIEPGNRFGFTLVELAPAGECKRPAFTLVELLVVIGIIALLVGILLPALNKARQQAYVVSCQARLRQIHQMAMLYATANKGSLPWGGDLNAGSTVVNGVTASLDYDWSTKLFSMLNPRYGDTYYLQSFNSSALPYARSIFIDVETETGWGGLQYSCHPRLMPQNNPNYIDPPTGAPLKPYKLSHIQRPSEIILFFDGVICASNPTDFLGQNHGTNTYWCSQPIATFLDGGNLGTITTRNTLSLPVDYLLFARDTISAMSNATSIDAGTNQDYMAPDLSATPSATVNLTNIRFRHMGNKVANCVYCDGHVESKHYYGTKNGIANVCDILRKNVNVN